MSVLETERLVLRPFRADDLDDLCAVLGDPEVARFIGTGQPRGREEVRERLQRILDHWQEHGFGLWVLIAKEGGGFVGHCGVGYLHGRGDAELSYTLARPYWGRGLATEAVKRVLRHAFEVLRLPRVIGVARVHNVASQRVMLRAGMTFREDIRYDGKEGRLYGIENPGGGHAAGPGV
jgi:ribosomal-protein-alanine N-acetyltransferase